ncbi:MAG: glutathione S-transferase family protein [Woeseiaceae bacterium]|nr:glutathione S-transferase family protein [Woeseiaceae bacterium]
MQLIGMLDSPFVRRVAVTARMLGIAYEHNPLSIFRSYDEFRTINPLVKVPTLICDDGTILVDSTLIIDYLETCCAKGRSLMPDAGESRTRALQIIGVALVAMEKVAQIVYERTQRPKDLQHKPWLDRLTQQLCAAVEQMETFVGDGSEWLLGPDVTQADIAVAIAWRFTQHSVPRRVSAEEFPGLVAFSERAEALPEFIDCPIE